MTTRAHHDDEPEERLTAFERRTAMPMFVLSLLLVPTLLVPLLVPLSPADWRILDAVDWGIWALFAVEYGTRLAIARRRLRFMRRNLIDLAIVVLPLARPLRFAASARAMRLLQASRIVAAGLRGGKLTDKIVTGQNAASVALVIALLVTGAAALEYDAEHLAAGANIRTVGDAFWWAVTTVSSVGYGDRYPVTGEGRLIATVLMAIGVCTTGLVAAGLAAIFIEQNEDSQVEPQLRALQTRLLSLERTLERIETRLTPAEDERE